MPRTFSLFAALSYLFVTACSSQQSSAPASSLLPGAAAVSSERSSELAFGRTQILPGAGPQWGIGVNARAQLVDGSFSYRHESCQIPGDSFSSCPAVSYGKRTFSYAVSKSLRNATFGSVSLANSATSGLGSQTYSQAQTASHIRGRERTYIPMTSPRSMAHPAFVICAGASPSCLIRMRSKCARLLESPRTPREVRHLQ